MTETVPPVVKLSTEGAQAEQEHPPQPDAAFVEDVHYLGDKDGKVVLRSPPKFENKEDERRYQKEHLAAAFRVFAKQGFDEGVAGHISLRDPINKGELSLKYHIYVQLSNKLDKTTSGSTP